MSLSFNLRRDSPTVSHCFFWCSLKMLLTYCHHTTSMKNAYAHISECASCLLVSLCSTFYIINWAVCHSNASVDFSCLWLGCCCMSVCSPFSQEAVGQSQGTALFEGGRLSEKDACSRTHTLTLSFCWPNKPCLLRDQQSQCINWPSYGPFCNDLPRLLP